MLNQKLLMTLLKNKTINITVDENLLEIFAGAGAGTAGTTLILELRENNYLGRGIGLKADATLTEESFKGMFSVSNPNFVTQINLFILMCRLLK